MGQRRVAGPAVRRHRSSLAGYGPANVWHEPLTLPCPHLSPCRQGGDPDVQQDGGERGDGAVPSPAARRERAALDHYHEIGISLGAGRVYLGATTNSAHCDDAFGLNELRQFILVDVE
jgi:hypothetical protein